MTELAINELISELHQWCEAEIDRLFNTLDPKRLTFKKVVFVCKRALGVISSCDAGEFMIRHQLLLTDENIMKFNVMADHFYLERKNILKELVLKLKNDN